MKQRIQSIDVIRGLIMIIMTLDHSRDFFHYPGHPPLNLQTTTVVLFFTRWITHFCAPTFVFLSGVSAYLAGQKRTKKELSVFLIKRGLWLMLSDLLIISLLFTFDLQYHLLVLEVLWATGFGMIILGLLIWTPIPLILALALIIIGGHNLFDYYQLPHNSVPGNLITIFFTALGAFIPLNATRTIVFLYAVIPWTGAILLGYVFGSLYKTNYDAKKRQSTLLLSGVSFIALFLILRIINHYGDPSPWRIQPNVGYSILSFINTTKQSPSLLFFAMTMGPVMLLLSYAEKVSTKIIAVCGLYGNVPYFYFIIHFCLLRLINIMLILIEGLPIKSTEGALVWQSPNFGHSLWIVYLIWIVVVLSMYYPCKLYGQYKQTHSQWWLSFI